MKTGYLFILILFLFACESTPEETQVFQHMQKGIPIQESFNVTYVYTDSGTVTARLMAPYLKEVNSLEKGKEGQTEYEMDRGITLITYHKTNGEEESRLTARSARINQHTGVALAKGNVVVTNKEGATLETEELLWYRDKDIITTQKFVKISTKEEIIMGEGMEANSGFNTYKIFHIKGTLKVKE